jgi:hypothetical protein
MKQNSYLVIVIIIISCLSISAIALLNNTFNQQTIQSKETTNPNNFLNIEQTIPDNNTIFQTGTEYLRLVKGYIWVLFDNTYIYFDTNNDGVYDYETTKNANEYMQPSDLNLPHYGSRVYSTKPILYSFKSLGSGYNSNYLSVPPIHALKNEYYVPSGDWHIGATQEITVYVDEGINGSIEQTKTISKLNGDTITTSDLSHIYSNDPFYCYNDYTFIGDHGKDYYLYTADIEQLLVFQDHTNISIDTDNDGVYDHYLELDKGSHTLSGYTIGSHLHANNSILLLDDYAWVTSYIIPSDTICSDYYSFGSTPNYGILSYIIGCFNNITIYGDQVLNNDLIPDYTLHIGSNEMKYISHSSRTIHLWGTKPFPAFARAAYSSWRWYYNQCIPSCITSMIYHDPNELKANQNVEMETRIFNPTATTNITNVTAAFTIDDAFALSGGTTLSITVEKHYLDNDTLIDTDTFTITPAHPGGNYTFTLTKSDTSLFNALQPMRYYAIYYDITTPTTVGNYQFKPVTIEYDASTWILPN